MNESARLTEYLQRMAGTTPQITPVAADRVKGLPIYLARSLGFSEWTWLERKLILATSPVTPDDELDDTARLKTRHRLLEEHFHVPVVLVLPALKAYRRDRLVQLRVPFIVPGTQLFIPPFADLCERYARQARAEKLSAAAQATVLYQLLKKPAVPMRLNAWAKTLGYSPMTLTKVRDELVAAELCVPAATTRARGLHFLLDGRELWEKARPSLRSPVARRIWVRHHVLPPTGMVKAGMTALAELTMIEGDPLPTYACRSTAVEGLLKGTLFDRCENQEEANARLECWRYDPSLLVKDFIVDRLSLYLSLADSDDERIRLACAELLEGVTW